MLTVILVIIGLSLLILGHEAGHFIVAKLSGMKVHEFGFGFPPRLIGIRRYKGAKEVPVNIDENVTITETETGVIVEDKIKETDILKPVKFWKFVWRKVPENNLGGYEGGTVYSINLLPFGGFVRIAGENDHMNDEGVIENIPPEELPKLFNSKPIWKRSLVVLAGVMANFILGWFVISAVFMIGADTKVFIGQIEPGSPAQSAGLMAGDIINGFKASQDFINFINVNKGKVITLNIFRNGKTLDISATPRTSTDTGKGLLGVYLSEGGIEKQGFFTAIWEGLKQSISICQGVVSAFWTLIKGVFIHFSLPRDIVGPVGIVSVAAETSKLGIIYFLQLFSLISLNLAVMNLLPFPALDGGRFVMLMIEKVKGSPVPKKVELWINAIGFGLLVLLMVIVTYRDIVRL